MTSAPPPRSGPRFGSLALALAWLVLLGVVAAIGGYVLMSPYERAAEAPPEPAVALRLAPGPEPAQEPAPAGSESALPERPQDGPPPSEAAGGPAAPAAAPEPEAVQAEPEAAQAEPEAAPEPEVAQAEPEAEAEAEAAPSAAPPAEDHVAALPRAVPREVLPQWKRNSQPFDVDDPRPRIAVVMTGLGLSSAATEAAIKQLPPAVTLSFTPYARRLNEFVALARVNGHEVMLDLPMEPTSYPDDDPGPQALLTALSAAQNLDRLRWALERTTGYVGVATVMGSRFLTSESDLEPILDEIKRSGLVFLDNRSSDDSVAGDLAVKMGVPSAVNDRFLDRALASRVAIDARLIQVERIAFTNGSAVAMGRPYPVTIERLREWSREVNKRGYVLAPITAVIGRTDRPGTAPHSAETE